MAPDLPSSRDRRLFLGGSLAALLAAAAEARADRGELPGAALPAALLTFVGLVADTLIPRTDTPGALDVGAPAFIDGVLARISTPEDLRETVSRLQGLQAAFAQLGAAPFHTLSPATRERLLEAIDLEAVSAAPGSRLPRPPGPARYLAPPDADLYRRLRALIVFAYYTSEAGATQELEFLPAPGEWAADIPLDPAQRNYFNVDRSFDPTVVGFPPDGF